MTHSVVYKDARAEVPWIALLITDGVSNIEADHIMFEASVARSKGIHFIGKVTDNYIDTWIKS